uniref:Uncharacterized protein n=1 Tax=Aegilops tauschii TaxID=37682 RepID=M8BTQ7_AEGTA
MALSALLLPSSTTTADTSDRRRGQQPQPPQQQQNHHSKRKKKPPSLPPPLSPAPRTPGRRHLAATGTPSRKSPALAAPTAGAKARLVAGKDHRQRRSGSKKAAAQKPARPASSRYPRPRELCPCSQCGEVFTKADSLEQHQAVRHAVSELGPEDSGRNIVEIIFKSSWQKRDRPICHIDRILKVRNPPRTVARFEAYRDAVRARCRADAAGAGGRRRRRGGGRHEVRRRDGDGEEGKEEAGPFDSVAGDDAGGAYGVLEELFVANPRAILPCFVVVYRVDVDAQ